MLCFKPLRRKDPETSGKLRFVAAILKEAAPGGFIVIDYI
jgi:hypothetical protein